MYGLLLLAALGADGTKPALDPRPYHEISRDLSQFLRREATATDNRKRAQAIYQLTVLYGELRRDARLVESETLTSYKNRLWSRLSKVKKELEREFGRNASTSTQNTSSNESANELTAGIAESLSLVGQISGGPAHLLSHVQGSHGGSAVPDFGPSLVELIERTIAPEFWDVAGGPGTVVYYAPLRALVVRATSEVHHDIRGVLGGLRAAGM
ncbi:MAG: hypothetical protein H6822_16195 [Planctomycetaceae bacterium]|nr:hypothetical protein [Planctomycetales bacterium]MCB9923722.1 hypothetical protein [Planctomycetaceae bacterium]